MKETQLADNETTTDAPHDSERREVLNKLGQFAAYTAPSLILLLSPRSGHTGSILDVPPDSPSF